MTVTDFRGLLGRPPNVQVATTLDAEGFWDLVLAALRAVGGPGGETPNEPAGSG
jgi:inosine-uridine nucleoside N-ribohydrolase